MYSARCVLALVALHVGVVHSWDIAVSIKDQLIFYTNGTKTNTVNLISQNPTALVYDEIHNMMLYVDKQNSNDAVCGYDLSTKDNKCFIKRYGRDIHGLAFDPATDMIFFTDKNDRSINWISLKPGSNNNIYGNLLIKMDDGTPADITVDSCRGYIYWTHADGTVERAYFDGSWRKVMSHSSLLKKFSLFIDPQTQQIFYFDICESCSNLHGYLNKNELNVTNEIWVLDSFYGALSRSRVLTVSKDYIYWVNSSEGYDSIWQLPKNAAPRTEPNEIIKLLDEKSLGITAKYNIGDQIKGIHDCDSLSNLKPTIKVVPGNSNGGRCNVSACENYCIQGNCSVDDEGLPKCSCNDGYSGKRCEIYACHGYCQNHGTCSLIARNKPVCQCRPGYAGDSCEITDCLNYCIQGSCSLSDEGLPSCSCNAGYSGERCEVSMCHGYCLNDGDCSLNEEDEPVCQCVGNYEGSRCEIDKNNTCTIINTPTFYLAQKNLTLADLLSNWRKPTARISVTVEV